MRTSFVLGLGLAALTLVPACSPGSTARTKTSSTVEGKLALTSFAETPSAVEAIDERGQRTRAPVGLDGSFRLNLGKAHVYKLAVIGPHGEVPVVFPRSNGRLDRTFRLSTGGALVALGYVHHAASAPADLAKPPSPAATSVTRPASFDENDDHDESTECEDGKPGATGSGVDGSDATEDANAAKPMALPDKNAPDEVAGCHETNDDDGDDDDDDDDDHDDD